MAVKLRLSKEVTMVTKAERDAWTFIYQLYSEFAAPLREADADGAAELFLKAAEKLRQYAGTSEGEQIIVLAGYDLLDAVWKASHKTP